MELRWTDVLWAYVVTPVLMKYVPASAAFVTPVWRFVAWSPFHGTMIRMSAFGAAVRQFPIIVVVAVATPPVLLMP